MSRTNLAWLLVIPALFALGIAVTATAPPPDKDYQLVRKIVDVLAEVDKHYVRELSDIEKKKLVEDMINGGLERLDPHSVYFNEEYFNEFENDTVGNFGGIGAILGVDPQERVIRVETPTPGTPAFEAGLQTGDLILKVDGKSTEGLTVLQAKKFITGKPDTKVTLTVAFTEEKQVPGKQITERVVKEIKDVVLTRKLIEQRTISGFKRDVDNPAKWNWFVDRESGIAMIRLYNNFNEKTTPELIEALAEIESANPKAVVLDLRSNPGGLLHQAISVADIFLPEQDIVSTKDRRERTRPRRSKTDNSPWENTNRPMAVLIDRNSASASEILAAALQDHKRAVIVGERSFGKGSVQKVYPFDDRKTAVKLTSEEWLRPSGQSIHRFPDSKPTDNWGVHPDDGLSVAMTAKEFQDYVKSVGESNLVKRKDAPDAPPSSDKVLNVAVEHLKKEIAKNLKK
jgi:carboxyl-terminal processing protease